MKSEKPIVEYDSKDDFILLTNPNEVNVDDLIFETVEAIKLINLHNCSRVLIDLVNVKSYPSLTRLYSFTRQYLLIEEIQKIKLAVVPGNMRLHIKLLLYAASKSGFNFRIFDTVKTAKESLLNK